MKDTHRADDLDMNIDMDQSNASFYASHVEAPLCKKG